MNSEEREDKALVITEDLLTKLREVVKDLEWLLDFTDRESGRDVLPRKIRDETQRNLDLLDGYASGRWGQEE